MPPYSNIYDSIEKRFRGEPYSINYSSDPTFYCFSGSLKSHVRKEHRSEREQKRSKNLAEREREDKK